MEEMEFFFKKDNIELKYLSGNISIDRRVDLDNSSLMDGFSLRGY